MIGSVESTRVVVLDPSGSEANRLLAAALAERGWKGCVRAADPYHAMVETCLLDRARLTRDAWTGSTSAPTVLVVSADDDDGDGADLGALKALLRAMNRYRPGVAVWMHQGGALRRLHPGATPAADAGDATTPPETITEASGRAEQAPYADLRLSAEAKAGPPLVPAAPAPAATGADAEAGEDPLRISAEEIEMLLVHEPGRDPGQDATP